MSARTDLCGGAISNDRPYRDLIESREGLQIPGLRSTSQPEVVHPRCHFETATCTSRSGILAFGRSQSTMPVAKLWFVLRCLALVFFQLEAPCAMSLVSNSVTIH
jgi:hypothetical protein